MDQNERISVLEQMMPYIPEYRDTMYLEGYKPYQIIEAASRSLYKKALKNQARINAKQEDKEESTSLNIYEKVYVNGKRI